MCEMELGVFWEEQKVQAGSSKQQRPTDARNIQSAALADERRLLDGGARACTGKAIGQRLVRESTLL